MSRSVTLRGHCLCGAVSIEATAPLAEGQTLPSVGACHCETCRTWGGGSLLAIECGTAVRFEGEAQIALYRSSDWADRGFCRQCGTHLFYRFREGGLHALSAGLFSAQALDFDHQVFVESRPDWYRFANVTRELTGAELFAQAPSAS